MTNIRRIKDECGINAMRVTFTLRECVDKEKNVMEILEDIEGKSVFLRDAVTKFAESDEFKKNRAEVYDGPGHRKRTNE